MSTQDHLPFAFDLADRTVPAMLAKQAERCSDKRLAVCGDVTWSYREAARVVGRVAGTLRAAGIGFGDRIGLMCGNRAENLALFLAAGWIGAITVPINTASKGPQIEYYLKNSAAKLFVVEAEYLPLLDQADLAGAPLERIWVIGESAPGSLQGVSCERLPPPHDQAPPADIKPGDTLAILYTSGTTGPSKGVLCPHAQYFWWGANSSRLLGVTREDILLTTLPLFHINALNTFAQALLTGATQVIEPRFSASGFWKSLVKHDATVTYLLGAMVPILMSYPPTAEERAHRARVALGPGVPVHLHETFRQRTNIALLEGYGSTETNFVIGDLIGRQQAGSMGRIGPGYRARVVDENDADVAAGMSGELLLRADEPFAFATGYFGMPEKTAEAWKDGWFHTGDRVVRGLDGRFRFVDRLKDAIRRRGENISSFEVEQVLLSHPDVKAAAVFPVRSGLAEDEVMAALVRKPGSNVSEIEVVRFCEPRLPYFAVPGFLEFFDDLPRTENGKIQKFQLRERGVTAATWSREAAGVQIKRR
jgi:crotonobetaine/carnitine-CoA ligase